MWNLKYDTDELIYEAETDSPPWRTVLWLSSVRGDEWIGNLGLAYQIIKKQIAALSCLFGSLMTITKMLRKFHVFLRMVMQSACSKYWWLFTSRKQLFIFSVMIYISSLNYFLLIPMADVKMMFRGQFRFSFEDVCRTGNEGIWWEHDYRGIWIVSGLGVSVSASFFIFDNEELLGPSLPWCFQQTVLIFIVFFFSAVCFLALKD